VGKGKVFAYLRPPSLTSNCFGTLGEGEGVLLTLTDFKKRALFIMIFLIFGAWGFTTGAYALTVEPSRCEVIVKPNKERRGEYLVTNRDNAPIKVKVYADKWLIQKGKDATSWIKISPSEITVPANSSRKVTYIVKAPKGVEGEYTSSIVFRSLAVTDIGKSFGATMQLRIAAYIVIKGTEIIDGEISKVEVLNIEPLKISVKVKNLGNIHIRPKGKMQILKIAGAEVGFEEDKSVTLALNPIEGPIFPNSEGEIGPKTDYVKLKPGHYKAKAMVEFSPDVILSKELDFVVPEKKAEIQ